MSDEKTVKQQRREARVNRRFQLEQLAHFMQQPIARKYVYELLASVGIYSTTFSTNALSMAFREGERNVGLRLVADLTEAAPDMYFQMLKEAGNERTASNSDADTGTSTNSEPGPESDT